MTSSQAPPLTRQSAFRRIAFTAEGRRRARVLGLPENHEYLYYFTDTSLGRDRLHHLTSTTDPEVKFTLSIDPEPFITFLGEGKDEGVSRTSCC